MRQSVTSGEMTVRAFAGTYVVLLGIHLSKAHCPGVLGFAIQRSDLTEDEKYWLSGYKTFASVVPQPAQGVLYSTRKHPIQGFSWSDFSAKPGHEYRYRVVALRGTPAHPTLGKEVTVAVTTESERIDDGVHQVTFNRGAAASQEYTRLFGDKTPDQVGQAAFDWLSRGAAEAIAAFIGRALDSGWGLRVGAYEFTDPKVLQALKDAWQTRHADVEILYHAENDAQKTLNEQAIEQAGIGSICSPRKAVGLSLSHNKIIVLTQGGVAKAILTGSTNFSVGGIYGHSNVVHVCEDAAIAAKYLSLWEELKKNRAKKLAAPDIEASSPLPSSPPPAGTEPVFSPRTDLKALDWYAAAAKGAHDALFMSFAFGMHPVFQDAYQNGTAPLRFALMESMAGPGTKAQQAAAEAKIIALRKLEENKFAIGAFLPHGAFDRWLAEKLSGLNEHVKYIHTKYMLVDPLGPNPLVVSGSANFSAASTTDNDENMLVIADDPRVADAYLGEFMRLYNHFAFRDWLNHQTNPDAAAVSHLDETDQWWKGCFGATFRSHERQYFAGVTGD
jgi:phosphatidylserine/phosphatidylglycerophosphate/cardiolipin synthase-like enzyme